MRCPVDNEVLLMSERNGVEIDFCPTCRGVWLDRGELDKLLRRDEDEWRGRRPDYDDDRGDDDRRRYPAKRKRWLSEMFDFD